MSAKYHVLSYDDDEYRVVDADQWYEGTEPLETLFHGTLADCEAWIRLTEQGYM